MDIDQNTCQSQKSPSSSSRSSIIEDASMQLQYEYGNVLKWKAESDAILKWIAGPPRTASYVR